MKKFFFAQIFVLVSFIMFSACTEKGLSLDEGQQPERQKVFPQSISSQDGIPVFSSYKEFKSTLQAVQEFTLDQRLTWESQMGFTSFGTLANQVYESVGEMRFNSADEFYEFVKLNSNYLQTVEYENDENEVQHFLKTKEFNNSERWLMNEDRMFIIDSLVYRFYDNNMAVAGRLDRLGDIRDFVEFDSTRIPRDCFAYSHIVRNNQESPNYPLPYYIPHPDDGNRIFVCTENNDRLLMTTLDVYTKATPVGFNNDICYETRLYVGVDCYEKIYCTPEYPGYLCYYWNPVAGEISSLMNIQCTSLRYNANNGTGWEIIGRGKSWILWMPNIMSYSDYWDFPLFYKNQAPSDFPEPWTLFFAWSIDADWQDYNIQQTHSWRILSPPPITWIPYNQ